MNIRNCAFVYGSELWQDCDSVTTLFGDTDFFTSGTFNHSLISVDTLSEFILNVIDDYNDDEINKEHVSVFLEKLKALKNSNPDVLVDLE